ncbi:hypothetical protein N7509_000195 [Penicillium cosmopolitanum]|uniref:Uncharacterized protein n=1 Tax=Penicillium cosmopolitanum TaxID=1131564 RepID=A0A9W9WCE0_9EURO|nr:uncharacterized protein N7509_000195 [Penicillium cosmopolitanum]KAJ5414861.1 hypothetical protein N7509_000195 [Penicillium cosmopolitanum]
MIPTSSFGGCVLFWRWFILAPTGDTQFQAKLCVSVLSKDLREVLRVVPDDIKAISLMEDKPSIEQKILFHFLPELAKYAENMNNPECETPRQRLYLLIDHLKEAYSAIS